MKKYYFIFAVAMAFLAACDNEDNVVSNDPTPNESQNITYIRAEANEGAMTRGSVDDEATFTWNQGDKIAVWADGYKISSALGSDDDGKSSVDFAFTSLTDGNRSNFAIYPASLVWDGTNIRSGSASAYTSSSLTLTLPASYTLAEVEGDVSPTPMIATNAPNGSLSFKALCPLLRVTVNNIPKQTKRLEFDFNGKKVQGEFTLTSVEAGTTAIATSATTGTDDIITVTMDGNDAWHDNLVVNLPVPTGTYDNITVTAYDKVTAGNAMLKITQPIKSGGWIASSRKASRKMTASLPVFSANNPNDPNDLDDTKFIFAPGNLQYIGSATTPYWKFADHQWEYLGTTTGQGSNVTNVDRDLFGWGTSGWNNGNLYYQPYNTNSLSNTDKAYGYGPTDGTDYFISLTDTYANADWGVYNAISNGGNTAGMWRTPSNIEWGRVIEDRPASTVNGTENARFAKAMVNSIHGIIIFPDIYIHPEGVTAPIGINDADHDTGWNGNNYSVEQWTKMEAAGAVFLPAAGRREVTELKQVALSGYYWTATSETSNIGQSRHFIFTDYWARTNNYSRYVGISVRLIRDVK